LDVHHRLAAGRHYQNTQADRRGVQHRGEGTAEQPAVRREDLQRTRAADRLLSPVFERVQLRRLPETVLRHPVGQLVGAAGAVRLSVRREGGRGRQNVRGRPERGAADDGLPEHVGLYVQQHAVHTQGLGVRRRRRLSGQLGRGAKLHE